MEGGVWRSPFSVFYMCKNHQKEFCPTKANKANKEGAAQPPLEQHDHLCPVLKSEITKNYGTWILVQRPKLNPWWNLGNQHTNYEQAKSKEIIQEGGSNQDRGSRRSRFDSLLSINEEDIIERMDQGNEMRTINFEVRICLSNPKALRKM